MITEKVRELMKKYQFFGWPLLSVLVSLVLLIFFIIPQIASYIDTSNLISDTRQKTTFLNTKAKTLSTININQYQTNLNLALAVLPTDRDIPTAIGQIQTLVTQTGMQIGSVSFSGGTTFGQTPSPSSAQSYLIKVEVLGTKDQLNNLFNHLNDGPEIMQLNGIDISSSTTGIIDANLNILTYYQSQPAVLEDVEKPLVGLTSQDVNLLSQIQKEVSSSVITSGSTNLPVRGKTNPFQ